MTEDLLTPDQRIRLESLAQANATFMMIRSGMGNVSITPDRVLLVAKDYEDYIITGNAFPHKL